MRKQLATVGLAAALVAGGAGALAVAVPGISSAQTATTVPADPADLAAAAAKGSGFLADTLAPLVADGTLTQAQADAVIAALQAARPGDGHGRGGPGGHGGRGLDAAATALNLSPEDLRAALVDGRTIAEVAGDQGVDVQVVIDALVADAQAHLAEEVAEGDLTQEEADAKAADLTARITEMVNTAPPVGGRGGGMGRHGHGPMGGDTTDDGATDDGGATTTPSAFSSTASLRGA